MNPAFDEISLEKFVHSTFGLNFDIKTIIADKIPVGSGAFASVILSEKGMLYVLIASRGAMNLGDVKKILTRMNLRAEQFFPPHGDPDYFNRIALAKFREVYPGRGIVRDDDLTFYRTLASYNPALVQIVEVVDGIIRQYDTDSVGKWRPSVKFSYRRIRTS